MWPSWVYTVSFFCALQLQAQVSIFVMSQESCRERGAVRLVGSANMTKGRLEICVDNIWGSVCNDGFDVNAARVVCRQLGFQESALPMVKANVFFGGGGSFQPIHLDELRCSGNEESLLNCTHGGVGVHNCEHLEDVGIICKPSQDCRDGDVRLVNESSYSATEGRVEFCIGGLWGTVCDSGWGDEDAKVVCRQLGLNATDPKALSKDDVPQVSNPHTPIVLDGVNCRGTEANLESCGRKSVVEYCVHHSNSALDDVDAGAFCTNIKECNDSDVRLYKFSGDSENEGRVEYCSSGRWILVCNDHWDNDDATVVCRQLGYNVNDGSAVAKSSSISGNTMTSTYLGGIDCVGTENTISECAQHSTTFCIKLGAGVICPVQNASVCTDGDVKLQGGSLSNEIGRVEVCASGQWGLVCDDEWDDNDATVVCRQLGYADGVATHKSTFGLGTDGVYVIDKVKCTGNESSILDCERPKNTHCHAGLEEAGAICRNNVPYDIEVCTDEYTNKTVSIVGSNTTNLTAGSIGTCQSYISQSNLCNNIYKSTDYIFTAMNQSVLSKELDERIIPIVSGNDRECNDLISKVVCHYFFAPCGEKGLLHLPLSVCPDECHYVKSACANEWMIVNDLLENAQLGSIDCNTTGILLHSLDPCCIDAEIEMKNLTTKTPVVPPVLGSRMGSTTTGIVIGILVAFLILLVGVIAVTIGLAAVIIKKRKSTIRSLQLEVLTSPTRTSIEPLTASFAKNLDDVEFGADVKLRGSRTYSLHAVPNPYSTKQELALASPLLSPTDNKMMNRISSSIIRELSSNMLIPYTRLKLMDCVGQGEFGVVYKGQYTEPEREIGYKTSTVAVKTLKGFFDNSQVNKIMEEGIKMKHFDHPNVLHLIGVCLDAGPAPYVVMPFMANGSLLHYLKKERNNIVLQVGGDEDVKIDVRKRLTVMCLQIASGMEYLAGEKFVHRDLAARNCMIDIHFVIKIADFGLSEDIYAKNYFRQSGSDRSVKLPVKWMAPESLTDGIFSEKSDVWSFGVTCWEVFSGGKTPYPGVDPLLLSQILETGQRLNKPLNSACPDELYTLMKDCWAKQSDKRPSFSDVVKTISNYTEVIAGYLDINFNPFESTTSAVNNAAAAVSTVTTTDPDPYIVKDKLANGSTELLADSSKMKTKGNNKKSKSPKESPRVSPKVSPHTSRKPSPKTSPRISPRASPLFKLRKLKDDHSSTKLVAKSTAAIEIRVESPP